MSTEFLDYLPQGKRYYSPREAMAVLHVGNHTFYDWRDTGKYDLPYVRTRRRVYYDADKVDALAKIRLAENPRLIQND